MVELRTYIVEDNATIRENLIGTLEELTCVKAAGFAETEGFPQKDELTSICFGVVVFSVVVQGLSISPLVKRAVSSA